MDNLIKVTRALGFCWCWPEPKVKIGVDLVAFQEKRLPIFWVCGPPCSNRTRVAQFLAKASGYDHVKISRLIEKDVARMNFRAKVILEYTKERKQVPDDLVVDLIKEHLYHNHEKAIGFIFSGFPIHVREAKIFELQVCKVSIMLYCTDDMDVLMHRMRKKYVGMEDTRIKAFLDQRHIESQGLYRHYENKTLKIRTSYSIQQVMRKILTDLKQFWGYTFDINDIIVWD